MAKEKSRAAHVMGGKSKKSGSKSGKHPREVHIRRGKSGGFIAKHIHDTDPGAMAPEPDEEHVLPDMSALHDHLDQTMGDQGAAPAPSPSPSPDMSQAGPSGPSEGPAGPGPGGPSPQPQPGM
jgi:hypothetical protein